MFTSASTKTGWPSSASPCTTPTSSSASVPPLGFRRPGHGPPCPEWMQLSGPQGTMLDVRRLGHRRPSTSKAPYQTAAAERNNPSTIQQRVTRPQVIGSAWPNAIGGATLGIRHRKADVRGVIVDPAVTTILPQAVIPASCRVCASAMRSADTFTTGTQAKSHDRQRLGAASVGHRRRRRRHQLGQRVDVRHRRCRPRGSTTTTSFRLRVCMRGRTGGRSPTGGSRGLR